MLLTIVRVVRVPVEVDEGGMNRGREREDSYLKAVLLSIDAQMALTWCP